jgi:hypothetical protein
MCGVVIVIASEEKARRRSRVRSLFLAARVITDFNDALRIGPPNGTIFHNRGIAFRAKGDYARAIADYDSIAD